MRSGSASPLPVVRFEGDCGFCLLWIDHWRSLTKDRVEYRPFEKPEPAVRIDLPDGTSATGAKAVFLILAQAPWRGGWLFLYENLPGFAAVSEFAYRFIAARRGFFHKLTKLLFGKVIRPANFFLVRAFFLKILALIYLVAFISIGNQITGLYGQKGILPAADYLRSAAQQAGTIKAVWAIPTVFWINSSDQAMQVVVMLGIVAAILLFFGILPRSSLAALFILYLSIVSIGRVFMSFQWDVLLLESGFLAILLSFSTTIVYLFRWLMFKFIFLSGVVKLLSGDPNWKNLTALDYHFQTQPLPTALAWYFHHLPSWVHKAATLGMFAVELVVPFFIFLPRRLRLLAAASIAGLETLILFTGNYTFFNFLTIALCLFLLDDELLRRLPRKLLDAVRVLPNRRMPIIGRSVIAVIAAFLLTAGLLQTVNAVTGSLGGAVKTFNNLVSQFRITNSYGLFAVMTTKRNEIEIQGSQDGENWQPYRFAYKPDDPAGRPRWVAPFQPRLDWQMWFAALDNFQASPWILNLSKSLLEGSAPVRKLFANDPFPKDPPKYLRAVIYDYQFSSPETKKLTGDWWERKLLGLYLPVVALEKNR